MSREAETRESDAQQREMREKIAAENRMAELLELLERKVEERNL